MLLSLGNIIEKLLSKKVKNMSEYIIRNGELYHSSGRKTEAQLSPRDKALLRNAVINGRICRSLNYPSESQKQDFRGITKRNDNTYSYKDIVFSAPDYKSALHMAYKYDYAIKRALYNKKRGVDIFDGLT